MTSEIPEVPGLTDLSPLGRGGLADVYLARQGHLERWVAAKVFRVTLADEQAAERFRAECRAIGRLDQYPHVLTVYDAGVLADGRPYLISERCDGSLHDLVSVRGPLPADRVAALGSTIARALRFAHSAGVLHGDVTPQNVLLRTSGAPVLADFGLAVLRENAPTAAGFTVAHAAPEALRSGAVIDERADVYGLGSTLYTLLTGAPPFPPRPDEDDVAYRERVRDEPAPTPDDAPEWLAGLLRAMLATTPDHRPSTDEVVAALQAAPARSTRPARPGMLFATRPDSDLAIDPTGVPVPAPAPRRGSEPSPKAVALWSRSMRPRGSARQAVGAASAPGAAHIRLDESPTRTPEENERSTRATEAPTPTPAAAPEPRTAHPRPNESPTRTPEANERSTRATEAPTPPPAAAPEPRTADPRPNESPTRTPEVNERSTRATGAPADRDDRPTTAGFPPAPRSAPVGESSGSNRHVRPAPDHRSGATPSTPADPTPAGGSRESRDPVWTDGSAPDAASPTGAPSEATANSAASPTANAATSTAPETTVNAATSTASSTTTDAATSATPRTTTAHHTTAAVDAPSTLSAAGGTVAPSGNAQPPTSPTADPDGIPAGDSWSCGRDDDPLGFTPVAEPVRIPGRPRRAGHRRVLVAATGATAVLLTGAGAGAAWRVVDQSSPSTPPGPRAGTGPAASGTVPAKGLPVELPAAGDLGQDPVTGRALAEGAFPGITRPTAPSARPVVPQRTDAPRPPAAARRPLPVVTPQASVTAGPGARRATPEGTASRSSDDAGDRPVAHPRGARSGDSPPTRAR